jgi:hypothetical protein
VTKLPKAGKPAGRNPAGATPRRPSGASSTARRVDALRRLLRDVCEAADARQLMPTWGTGDGPERPGARFVIDGPRQSPFAKLGVIPWPDETYGGVQVTLRGAPWDWTPVDEAFGPFREEVQIPGAPRQLVATWDEPGLPATAWVSAWVGLDGLQRISIRRDPRPGPM